jgi:hypothetical protein
MRGLRSFLVLLIILIGLGAYLYFVESKRTPGDSGGKRDKVFAVEADKIEEIRIRSASGETTTLQKKGAEWQIVEPVVAKSDEAEVSGLTSNLSSLEIQRVVDENVSDLKQYGLAEPRVEVAFKSGGQERRLQIGEKTPPGTDLYAKLADETRVFLIASYLDSTFNRTTFDLRDKAVLKLDRDKVDAMEVVRGGQTLRFEKKEGEWRMTSPLTARADYSAVEGVVGRVSTLQMKSIAAAEPKELKTYGLEPPVATVRLNTGSSQAALAIGSAAGEGAVYARDVSRPMVFSIESGLADDLKKDPAEYRQKDVFDARAYNTTRIEVVRNGQTFAFEKTKTKNKEGQEEEKWRQTSPTARDVDQPKVDALVSAVTAARATTFVEKAAVKVALDKPELTVTIKFEDGKKEERVMLGRSGKDAFASRADLPDVAKLDATTLDNTIKALEALK